MGGSMNGLGNSNRTAEFNMKYDPESAFIVFQSSSKLSDIARRPLITIVPWETTLNHSLSWSFLEELRLSKSDKSYFLDCITNLSRTFKDPTPEKSNPWKGDKLDNHKRQLNSFLLPDIYAVIACLYPTSIERYDPWSVKIELQGIETRGMTHVNWTSPDDCPNAKIITEMNMPFIKRVMMDCFSDINWPLQANQNQV
ncbi:Inosine/uridine-preferring nucleoside hydrolase domain-containing protein [Globomyces pollinis-pini]|nr:Inosine/uridine-preferring nucleoside hydrolase domain-containing protein [Globomyces pollinis-pini]